MANTNVLSGLELTKWQREFWREYVRDTGFAPYMGSSPTDIIHVMNDLETDGYTIRIPLVGRLQGNGVTGDTLLGGQEESLDQYYQDISWEFYRHALSITKKQKKKSAVDLLAVMRPLLKEWAAELKKYQMISTFHQMSSGTSFENATTAERNTFALNNVDRILFGITQANYSATHATGLANVDNTADKLSTAMGSLAKFMARQARPHIRPFKNGTQGREYYVMFCHPLCFRDLKNDTIMIAANRDSRMREGDGMDKNPIFQDGDLIYDGVIYREIPEFYMGRQGNNSINAATHLTGLGNGGIDVGANFLCGAQAIGWVNKQAPLPTKKNEDDYGFVDGTGIELAHGYSKLRWNNGSGTNKDVGIVTVYAAAVA